jgi:hypothetical protein
MKIAQHMERCFVVPQLHLLITVHFFNTHRPYRKRWPDNGSLTVRRHYVNHRITCDLPNRHTPVNLRYVGYHGLS